MKTIEFKVYEGASSTLDNLGTLKDVAGAGGKIAFLRKNYNNPDKRVAIVVTKKDGTSATIACSAQVSAALRNKEVSIKQLVGFNVVGGEKGFFIAMPATGAVQTIELDSVVAESTATKEGAFLPEELVAL